MADNEFKIELSGELDKAKTKAQVTTDAQNLGDIPVKLVGELDMSKTNAKIQQQMSGVTITPTVNTQGVQTATKQALNNAQKVANNNKVSINFDTNKEQLVNQIKILGKQNDKLFNNKEMTDKYNKLLNSANIAKSSDELKNLRSELSAFKTELVATDNAGMKWTSKFKETVSSYSKFFSGASFVYTLSNQLREAWTEAKELDKSYTDLIKVQSELTRSDYPEYLAECNKRAQDLATTQQSLIDGATEFSKSGYSKSESDKLAEKAVMLSNVGDMSASDSAKAIISGVQAYDVVDGYDNIIDKAGALIDKYNEIGNTASITTAEIAQGVQTVGSVFADANTSVDQFIALLSAGNRQFQDADTLSLGLRTAALRIRGCKAELSQLGETTEGVYTSSSKLADKIAGLTNIDGKGGVQILEEDGKTFRSIYDIFVDISKVYQQMSDTDQSALLDLIAGKNRASAISATLNNMTEAQEIYERSLNSAGSAQREYDTYLESSEAALNRFKSNMTETYQSVVNGNTVRDLANMGSAVLSFANSFGIVEGTLRGVVAIGIGKFITTGTMAFLSATKQVEQYGKALKMVKDIPNTSFTARNQALNSIAQTTSNLTAAQLKNVLSSKTLTQQERVRILQMQGMSKEMAVQKLSEMGLTQATNAQTAANTAQTVSTFSLKAALTGLGATIKSVFLSNPLGITLMGISLAVSAVSSSISKHKQELEEQKQKTQEAADDASTYSDELSELSNKYMQLSNAVKTDSSAKEELMSTQTELLKKLGLEGESIDTLIDKYGSLDEAINQASIDSLKKSQIDLLAGVDTAREALLDATKDNFTGSNNIISASGNDAVKAFKELEKAGVINSGSFGEGGGTFVLTGDDSVDGALENYHKLEEALNALRDSGEFTSEELSNNPLYSELYNRYNELSDVVEDYNTSIENLNKNLAQQTMLTSLQGKEVPKTKAGFEAFKKELVASAIASKQFIGNEKEIESAINSYLSTVPEFKDFYSLEDGLQEAESSAKEYADAIDTVAESTQKVILNISSLDSILSSQKSGQSISIEDFTSDDLKDYQSALEYVNGTMQLNAEKCRDIAKAKAEEQISINNTNKALKQSEYLKNAGEIEKLRAKLSTLTKGTDDYNDTETKLQSLLSSNEAISTECAQYDLLTTALKEATGAYNNWLNAQNGSDYGDMFDSSLDAFNRIMDTYNSEKDSYGDFGSKKFDAAVEFIVPDTVDTDDINAIQSYMNSFKQYLTFDSDGNTTGMDIEQFCKNAVDKGLMVLDEAGENYEIAGQTTMEDFANGLNLSLPMVQAFFDEMQLKGGEFDWADEAVTTVGDLGVKAYESAEALRNLKGDSDLQIQMDVSEVEGLDNKLSTLDGTIEKMNDLKASPDVDTTQIDYANDIIQYCVAQKQKLNEPVFMTINADQVEGDLGTVLGLIQQLQSAKNEYDIQASVGADTTEADKKIGELVSQIQDQGAVIKATIGDIDTTNVDTILAGVSAKSAEMWVNLGVNETAINDYVPEDKTATVTYEVNSYAVDMYDPKDLKRTVTYTVVTNGDVQANGTAHVNGTVRDNPRIGRALASGDWRTQKDENALVGELGTELVVYGNKYWTVGDTGAEFTHIPKGAIVFNHKQTEEIFKNGYVTSDGGRGHAYLNGTAYVKGGISASWANKVSSASKSSSSSKSSGSSTSSSSSDSSADTTEETLDEIEIKIKRIERDITNLDSTVQATYKSWSERNKALVSEMSNVRSEIEIQQQAYNRYMQEAESVGLSSDWAAKIREGRIEIEKITDEDLKKKIDLYQQWWIFHATRNPI